MANAPMGQGTATAPHSPAYYRFTGPTGGNVYGSGGGSFVTTTNPTGNNGNIAKAEEMAKQTQAPTTSVQTTSSLLTSQKFQNTIQPQNSFITNLKTLLGIQQTQNAIRNTDWKQVQNQYVPQPVQNAYTSAGSKIMNALTSVENKVSNFVSPKTTQDLVLQSRQNAYTQQVNQFNKDIDTFNQKYGGTLNQSQVDQANQELNNLNTRGIRLFYQEKALESQAKGLATQTENRPTQFVRSMIGGVATFPVAIAKLGAGAVFQPVQTAKDQYTSIKNLPAQFISNPATTGGSLVGQALAGAFAGEVVGVLGSSKTTTIKEVKPKTTISKSFSDSVKVGNVRDIDVYLNRANIVLKKSNPNTGRLVSQTKTDVEGYSFVKPGEDMLIVQSKATAGTTGLRSINIKPGLKTASANIMEAKSKASFDISNVENNFGLIKGTSQTQVNDLGKLKIRVAGKEGTASIQYVKTRLPEKFESLSDIITKELKTITTPEGNIRFDASISMSDVLKTTGKVKRYTKETGTKVSSYLRSSRKVGAVERNLNADISRTSSLTSDDMNIGGFESGTKTILDQTTKTKAVKSSFENQVNSIASVLEKKASKPIKTKTTLETIGTRTPTTTLDIQKTASVMLTPSIKEAVMGKQETKQTPEVLSISGTISGTTIKTDEYNGFFPKEGLIVDGKVSENQRQSERQQLGLQTRQSSVQQYVLGLLNGGGFARPGKPSTIKKPGEKFKPKFSIPDNRKKKVLTANRRVNKETFFGITKRRGKEFVVAKNSNPLKVIGETKKYALNTLAASVRVVSSRGRELKLNPDQAFRQSKRNPDVLVQRSGGRKEPYFKSGRLTSRGERQEIKSLRTKKIKW
jgi:hypothetical protein